MVEAIFFLAGLGFSVLVYVRSIHGRDHRPAQKALYFFLTFLGITGFLLLFGVMVTHLFTGRSNPLF